jgi:hypothetical protein
MLTSMEFSTFSHTYGESIVKRHFRSEAKEILAVIASASIPIRDKVKKQSVSSRAGKDVYKLYPADLPSLNSILDEELRDRNWDRQPYASEDVFALTGDRSKGDFVKNGVFVEVEFGNTASLFRDLFKFQVASRERKGKVAVLIVPHRALATLRDSGVTHYEKVFQIKEYLSLTIQMPIWVIGLKPEIPKLKQAYTEMYRSETKKGLLCRTWSEALGKKDWHWDPALASAAPPSVTPPPSIK